MALAEARAAWQRTANRCFVQEDAKRLACSSLPSSAKPDETTPTSTTTMQDIPASNYLPFDPTPSHPNLSPNTRWWLQLQPNYGYQMELADGQLLNVESYEDDSLVVHQTSHVESSFDNHYQNSMASVKSDATDEKLGSVYYHNSVKIGCQEDVKELRDEVLGSFEVLKKSDDISFDSESSWVGVEKNTPWWRTADTEELALAVAQRSHGLIENCDLPMPQNAHVKKNLRSNGSSLSHDGMMTSLPTSFGSNLSFLTAGSSCPKLRILSEDQLLSPLSMSSQSHKRKPEMHASDEETSKAQLLEALRHSQTRAREAEQVAKQVCAEKEHVVKLLIRQASEIFAYKQWLQILQLENMYLQFRNNKKSSVFSEILPSRTKKSWPKSSSRKRAKRARPRYDVGRYAIVFALGLGIIGAGLFLGWMLPIW